MYCSNDFWTRAYAKYTFKADTKKDVDNLIKTMNIRAVEQNTLDFLSKIGEANVK